MFDELNKIDIKALRSFIAIAECQGVTAAQTRLNLSPSVISGHLSHLEGELGMTLCHRGRGGFELTEDGMAVYEACLDFNTEVANFRHQLHYIKQLDSQHGGHVRLSLSDQLPDFFHQVLQSCLADSYANYPCRHFSIRLENPEAMTHNLMHGESDLGIGYFANLPPALTFSPAFTEKQVVCCGQLHPLFNVPDDDICIEELNHKFAWVERGYVMDERLLKVSPEQLTATAYHMDGTAQFVLAGQHLGYLPFDYAKRHVEQGNMRIIQPDNLSYDVVHHWAHRAKLTKPIASFMAKLKQGLEATVLS